MTVPTLEELRTFLHLGARGEKDGVPTGDVERQEQTVLRALEVLEDRPGVVLADEVGMGKTFEALGVLAAFRHANAKARVVILTPGPDLNRKWLSELRRFGEGDACVYDFSGTYGGGKSIRDLVEVLERHSVAVAPITAFDAVRGLSDRSYLLSLFFDWKGMHGNAANGAIDRLARAGRRISRVDVRTEQFLDTFSFGRIERHLDSAFRGGRAHAKDALDRLYNEMGQGLFDHPELVKRGLEVAKFRLVRALLPDIDLLIVDEAHKLKNADGVRVQGVLTAFRRKFAKALFLTATPFQLDVGELRQVFRLFEHAKTAPPSLAEEAECLIADVRDYQLACDGLMDAWSMLDAAGAAEFRRHYEAHPDLSKPLEDPELEAVAKRIREVRRRKDERIEPAFRTWMIRSLREEKRVYRKHDKREIVPRGASAIPFLLYERLIAELFRSGDGTHKAAVEINLVSSYGAAREGALLADHTRTLGPEAQAYRDVLRDVLSAPDVSGDAADETTERHPKLEWVLEDALDAAERGEKTLVFCARTATIRELGAEATRRWRTRLLRRWQRGLPDATLADVFGESDDDERSRGRHALLRGRFRAQYILYLGLRERYLRTLVPAAAFAEDNLAALVVRANELLRGVQTTKASADRIDFRILKRCVERAAVEAWREASEPRQLPSLQAAAVANMLDERFIAFGLDLEPDHREGDEAGTHVPTWSIGDEAARLVIGEGGGLWAHLTAELRPLDLVTRVAVVEEVAHFLLYPDVPFLADLAFAAKEAGLSVESFESREMLTFLDDYWTTPAGHEWVGRISVFLRYLARRAPSEQQALLSGPLSTPRLVRHTLDGESRERLREAFNTPLYPMILVANEVMQEGLDLHRSCSRIVHHDLAWNPAVLEQRVGRIDRLGSLTALRRKDSPAATLDVAYPLIHRTIDVRLHRTVKAREKWLEFLLGATPKFEEYSFDEEPPEPLPDALAASLAIDLRPRLGVVGAMPKDKP